MSTDAEIDARLADLLETAMIGSDGRNERAIRALLAAAYLRGVNDTKGLPALRTLMETAHG